MAEKRIPVCTPLLEGNELKYVTDAVSTGWISSSGTYVTRFEESFAAYCGAKYGISTTSGTTALHLALCALGIGEGDEVILPTFTMIASAFAVCYTGATPVFVDADPRTWNIDVHLIEEKITSKTKGIMPVHLFGTPCDMDVICQIANKHGLFIIEDAAEAHGATYRDKKTGNLSDIAAFSFFANKNITTGEGGMCVTNDQKIADRCRYYKNLCFPLNGPRNYQHEDIGFNYRMSNLHAALGLAQTEKADEYRELRMKHAAQYRDKLRDVPGIVFPDITEGATSVYWMNAIRIDPELYGHSKDDLMAYLKEQGIETRLLFTGMHRQRSLLNYGCDCNGDYPVSDQLTENGFYLPSGSGLTEEEIDYVCDKIKERVG